MDSMSTVYLWDKINYNTIYRGKGQLFCLKADIFILSWLIWIFKLNRLENVLGCFRQICGKIYERLNNCFYNIHYENSSIIGGMHFFCLFLLGLVCTRLPFHGEITGSSRIQDHKIMVEFLPKPVSNDGVRVGRWFLCLHFCVDFIL